MLACARSARCFRGLPLQRLAVLLTATALVTPALAQGIPGQSFTDMYVRTQSVTTQTVNVPVSNFLTQLIGRLNTGQVVFDQSYAAAFGSGLVQGALNAVRAAITSAGGPAVMILSPVRTASQSAASSSSTSADNLAGTSQNQYVIVSFGPTTVVVGDRGICTTPGTAAEPPAGCSLPGTTFVVVDAEENFNTVTVTNEDILRTTTVTTTTTLNETYEVVGVVTPVGGVHVALMREASLGGERFLKRLLGGPDGYPEGAEGDGEALFNRVWLEAYGAWGALEGDGDFAPGYDSDVSGVSAGLGREVTEGLTLSAGIDVSRSDADMALPGDYPERGAADLTQIGVVLHKDWGRAEAGLAFTYGWGTLETVSGLADPGVSTSKADLALWGVEGWFGMATQLGGGSLMPYAGFVWVNVDLDGAVESGSPFALIVDGADHGSFRLFAGLDYAESFMAGQGDITLKLSVRVLQELGDEGFARNAAFVSGGGSLPLVLADEGRTAGEVEAGLSFAFGDTVSLHTGYEGRFSEGSDIHAVKAGVTVRF